VVYVRIAAEAPGDQFDAHEALQSLLEEVGVITELFENHLTCNVTSKYHVVGSNRAASGYAQLGQGASDFEMVGCLMKSFLFVSGLKGAEYFPTDHLLTERGGAYQLSDLARCALKIVYAEIVDHRGNGANTAASRMPAAFENEESCQ